MDIEKGKKMKKHHKTLKVIHRVASLRKTISKEIDKQMFAFNNQPCPKIRQPCKYSEIRDKESIRLFYPILKQR